MNWQEIIEILINNALSIIAALTSLIIVIIKTRQKAITKKVNNSLTLSDYEVEIEGKTYKLSELKIKKK